MSMVSRAEMSEARPAEHEMTLVIRGPVPTEAVAYARQKISRALEQAPLPVIFVRVRLERCEDRARPGPAIVEVTLALNGCIVRAHWAGRGLFEAVDVTEDRLRNQFRRLAGHRRARRHEVAPPVARGWFSLPPEEREVLRRKALPLGECTVEEATFDMELLDHDFYLFREAGSVGDSLLVRDGDQFRHERIDDAPGLSDEEAIERMDATDDPFVFYRDARSGRGRVLYRRYDGHFGLLEPDDAEIG